MDNTPTATFQQNYHPASPVHPGASRTKNWHTPNHVQRITTENTRRFRPDQIPRIVNLAAASTGLDAVNPADPRAQRIIVDLLRGASRLPVGQNNPHGITGDLLTVVVVVDESGEPQRIVRGELSVAAVAAFCEGLLTVPATMYDPLLTVAVSDPQRGLHIEDLPRHVIDDALRFAVYTIH